MSNLVDVPIIFQKFLDGIAIAEPIKGGTPKETMILSNGPLTTGAFANEGMKVSFAIGATTSTVTDRTEAGTRKSDIEQIFAGF